MLETKKQPKKEIVEVIDLIKKLKTVDLPVLIDALKSEFSIVEENIPAFSATGVTTTEEKEKSEENVSLKIVELIESSVSNKLQVYKLISEIAKDFGNDINIIQAKKLVEEKGILANNVDILRAKEIKNDLKDKGVEVIFV